MGRKGNFAPPAGPPDRHAGTAQPPVWRKLVVMRLDPAEARDRFVASRVLRLATVGAGGQPHLVPCVFAVDAAGKIVIGIDDKPKSSLNLRRLANVTVNPRVSLLVDHYSEDWERLWWTRADGVAAIERAGAAHAGHWRVLRAKYPQYEGRVLGGAVIVVQVSSWSGWSYASPDQARRTST